MISLVLSLVTGGNTEILKLCSASAGDEPSDHWHRTRSDFDTDGSNSGLEDLPGSDVEHHVNRLPLLDVREVVLPHVGGDSQLFVGDKGHDRLAGLGIVADIETEALDDPVCLGGDGGLREVELSCGKMTAGAHINIGSGSNPKATEEHHG